MADQPAPHRPRLRRPAWTASPRPGRGRDRRERLAAAAVVVVAVLGVAALIGSGAGRSGDELATSSSGASAGGGGGGGDGAATEEAAFDRSGELSAPEASTTVPAGAPGAAVATDASGGDADSAEGGPSRARATGPAGAPVEPKVVRTGSLELEVAKGRFDAATGRLRTIAAGAGGFVSASETSALDDAPRGSLTLRVPADRFDAVVGQVGEVGDVRAVTTSSQDVTGEYTDVASRLKALQSEREQIQLVLGRAENIPDILSVRDRLAVVQGEIEQLQGRQQVLDDQTSLSTLTVALHEKGDEPAVLTRPVERSGFSRLWHDAADRFTDGGRSIALGLATMAPWLLLGLVLLVPARAVWRRTAPVPAGPPAPPSGAQAA